MSIVTVHLKPAVAACALIVALGGPLGANSGPEVAELLSDLRSAEGTEAKKIARDIEIRWSNSGSATANLLLKRGEDALDGEEWSKAVEHFTALTDHAPDFAEGWHGRAKAFFNQGLYGLALEDLKQTLALNPDNFAAIYGLGLIMEQIGKPDEAFDAYQILLNLYPAHEKALEATARLERHVNGEEL